ncbi:uncharacterized protein [Drosophila pseudoobscura]|uniref:Uncharacterized protein isoform X1 n=1 Tax=Drosophila pseudoobscura pseudoobscura TaxID=46245 RepID=A0A6I8W6K1_DROPS|nr:uncharacterized protein LOC26532124 isoform X1 [Drosophila pseudoobscura]
MLQQEGQNEAANEAAASARGTGSRNQMEVRQRAGGRQQAAGGKRQAAGRLEEGRHKGNMLHMHSPKAICIQMLPRHFTEREREGGREGGRGVHCTITNRAARDVARPLPPKRKRVKAAS